MRRPRRPGDARLGREDGHDLLAPQQGDGAGLPLLPGAGSAAARSSTSVFVARVARRAARAAARRSARASSPSSGSRRTPRRCSRSTRASPRSSRRRRRCTSTPRTERVANFMQSEVLRDVDDAGPEGVVPVHRRGRSRTCCASSRPGRSAASRPRSSTRSIGEQPKAADVPVASLVSELGMAQVSDPKAIEEVCAKVIADNPKQAEQLRAGKTALFGFFVGPGDEGDEGQREPAARQRHVEAPARRRAERAPMSRLAAVDPSLPAVRPVGRVLIVDDNAELVDTLRAVIASGVRASRSRRPRTAPRRCRWRRRASTSPSST